MTREAVGNAPVSREKARPERVCGGAGLPQHTGRLVKRLRKASVEQLRSGVQQQARNLDSGAKCRAGFIVGSRAPSYLGAVICGIERIGKDLRRKFDEFHPVLPHELAQLVCLRGTGIAREAVRRAAPEGNAADPGGFQLRNGIAEGAS